MTLEHLQQEYKLTLIILTLEVKSQGKKGKTSFRGKTTSGILVIIFLLRKYFKKYYPKNEKNWQAFSRTVFKVLLL